MADECQCSGARWIVKSGIAIWRECSSIEQAKLKTLNLQAFSRQTHNPWTDPRANTGANTGAIAGTTMGDMNEFRSAVSLFTSGALEPIVDTVCDAADAAKAYERLESGEQFGKVVIRWAQE